MKFLITLFIVIFLTLQYKLWFESGSVGRILQLKKEIATQKIENEKLAATNASLEAEVKDLKTLHQAIEERARNDLGMVKRGETFYQIIYP